MIGLLAAFSRRLLKSTGPEVRHAAALAWLLLVAGSPVVIFLRVFEPGSKSTEATGPHRSELPNGRATPDSSFAERFDADAAQVSEASR